MMFSKQNKTKQNKTKLAKVTALGLISLGAVFNINETFASTIDTTSSWDGTQSVNPFGETAFATFGQTFTVGSDNYLNNFTLYLNDFVNSYYVDFRAYVMAWDGSKTTGSVLYESGNLSTTNNNGLDGMEAFTFNTSSLLLNANAQYVAFVSVSKLFDGKGDLSLSSLGVLNDAYIGGNLVYISNGSDFNMLSNRSWNNWNEFDLAMTMNFSNHAQVAATPVPTAVWLFGSGLAGLVASRRKKTSLAA